MANKSEKTSSKWEIKGLAADGPDSGLKEKLMLFGQFVGDWDIVEARVYAGGWNLGQDAWRGSFWMDSWRQRGAGCLDGLQRRILRR